MSTGAKDGSSAMVAVCARRLRGKVGTAACSLLGFGVLFAIAATPAFSFTTHLYDPTTSANFSPTSGAIGVAVDQSDGSVYIGEFSGGAVHKFNAAGEPVPTFGGGTGAISGFGAGPWHLAVDQASHDLYVATEGSNQVHKFDSEGKPIASFGTAGVVSVHTPIAIAVDPTNGNLYAANYQGSKIVVFSSAGAPITEFSSGAVTNPLGVAFDSAGKLYLASGGYGGAEVLATFDASGVPEGVKQLGAFKDVTVNPANGHVLASRGGEIVEYGPGAESVINDFGAEDLEDPWGVAVNEKTGQVYVANFFGSKVAAFGPPVILADVATDPPVATNVGHKSATLTGEIGPDSGPPVSKCDLEYGVDTTYSSTPIPCKAFSPITAATPVSAELTGLAPLTTYHYRFAAQNENGVSFGPDQTVKPEAVLGVETGTAADVSVNQAELAGSFQVDPEGGETHYHFEWGLSEAYGNNTPEVASSTTGANDASAIIDGLSAYTQYHYRIVATDGFGTTYGKDQTLFTAQPSLPRIDRTSSSGPSPTSATLEAEINPGFGVTLYRFQYGPTDAYGAQTFPGELAGSDGSDHMATVQVSNLTPGTTYHYRVIALNFTGLTTGPDQIFDTPALPALADSAATAVGPTSASLGATVKPGFRSTTYHFEYGRTSAFGLRTPESASLGSDNALHRAGSTLTGLEPATVYHFRIVVSNEIGTADGPDQTFTTTSVPAERHESPGKCKRRYVRKGGSCVKRHRHHKAMHHKGNRRNA